MGVVGEGAQGFWSGARGGGERKSVHGGGVNRVTGRGGIEFFGHLFNIFNLLRLQSVDI